MANLKETIIVNAMKITTIKFKWEKIEDIKISEKALEEDCQSDGIQDDLAFGD